MATIYPIEMTRGDRWKRRFRFRTNPLLDENEDPLPPEYLDMEGFTGFSTIRADYDGEIWASGIVVVGEDVTSWYVDVTFLEAETGQNDGIGVWDLELTDPLNGPYTWLIGPATLRKDVSHA